MQQSDDSMTALTDAPHMSLPEASTQDIAVYDALNEAVWTFWLSLFATLRSPTLFQHPAWHEAFIAGHYQSAKHGQLLFVTVTRDGQPAALIPLSYHKTHRYGLPARIVELMFPTDMGVRDIPIRSDIDPGALLNAVLTQALPQAGYPWDVAEFSDIVTGSTAFGAFQQLQGLRKLSTYHHDSNRLKCGDSLTNSYVHLSKSHIKKTKRKRKNIDALCSGQLIPDTVLSFSSATAGASPLLN